MEQIALTKPKGVKLPLFIFLLPFLLLLPYLWLIYRSSSSNQIVTPRLDHDHRSFHLTVFWVLTFLPFTAVCFLISTVMLVRRARHSRAARWSLALPGACFLAVLVLLILVLSGR